MRVVLEVTRNPDGVLHGTAGWTRDAHTVSFHGVLELIAAVESALAEDEPSATTALVAERSGPPDAEATDPDVGRPGNPIRATCPVAEVVSRLWMQVD
jgi:hypothetical protein